MPLTEFQATIARLLSENRRPESHLAGGAALHIEPRSVRYSNDLDYFHDSVEIVAAAFEADRASLEKAGYSASILVGQPGFIRAIVSRGEEATKVEWAYDSAWRFLPPVKDPRCGYRLHPVDLAVNKVLALVGRDEARDLVDVVHADRTILPLGALVWAAAGKDPGLTPPLLLDLLARRGRVRPEMLARLSLVEPIDPVSLKEAWLEALGRARVFVSERPPEEIGCLYYSPAEQRFVAPDPEAPGDAVPHYGEVGGVLPRIGEE